MNGRQSTATGFVLFAAILLIINGLWGIFAGLAAILKSEFFVLTPNYIYEFDTTAWGWIHLLLGALVVVVGIALLTGQSWARWPTLVVVVLQALAQFFFIPYYPWWAILIIVLDVVIIWALLAYEPKTLR
ncbi:hypothetical protein ABGB12_26290 [Actinocorallia sp. B10E7]|uniref:DUF7144 family membrane protein n=1 Tax=Actinocorallia sp. B10E7 TaxID=3153558 RepID=UPI00325E7171